MSTKIYKLDRLDMKILYELDRNSRQSASKIAKKCRVHRNVVNFRIDRFVKRGIIRQFIAMMSPAAMGLTPYRFYIKFHKNLEMDDIVRSFPVYWAAKVSGQWDYVLGVLAKSTIDAQNLKLKLLEHIGKDVALIHTSVLVEAPHYHRKYLGGEAKSKYLMAAIKQSLDQTDAKILHILALQARKSAVEIAEELNLSAKTIANRIRRLEKGTIYDYRIALNLEKIGYKYFKCLISLEKANVNELMEYCRMHNYIIHVVQCLGDWDIELECEVPADEDYYKILDDVRKYARTVETMTVIKEESYVCLIA